MPSKRAQLTEQQVLARIRPHLKTNQLSLRGLALTVGISPMFLCDVLKGRRAPTGKLLEYFCITRSVVVTINYEQEAPDAK